MMAARPNRRRHLMKPVMGKFAGLAALLLNGMLACQPAYAETCPTIATGTCACTVGTSAGVCLNARTTAQYRLIVVDNESDGDDRLHP